MSDHGKSEETQPAQAGRYVGVIRDMIRHEDGLVNQRLSWMWTLQGLLFGATGFFWQKEPVAVMTIAAVGLLSCISIGYSLVRGLDAIKDLLALSRKRKQCLTEAEALALPPTIGSRRKAREWLLPARALPVVFSLAWLILVFLQLR